MLRYLNLCSEEGYLHDRRDLAKDIWNIRRYELSSSLASPLIRQEWAEVRSNYDSFPECEQFVDAAQM